MNLLELIIFQLFTLFTRLQLEGSRRKSKIKNIRSIWESRKSVSQELLFKYLEEFLNLVLGTSRDQDTKWNGLKEITGSLSSQSWQDSTISSINILSGTQKRTSFNPGREESIDWWMLRSSVIARQMHYMVLHLFQPSVKSHIAYFWTNLLSNFKFVSLLTFQTICSMTIWPWQAIVRCLNLLRW